MPRSTPDLALLDDVVASRVLDAMRATSEQLARLGVRHCLVGGLAVGAYGHPRATKDVDFLVGDEAFEHHAGGIVTMKAGVPIQANGVVVDHLSPNVGEDFLTELLPRAGQALAVAPAEVLIYLKLKSPRAKDRADIVELVKAGLDVGRCRDFLTQHAPQLLSTFAEAEAAARAEE